MPAMEFEGRQYEIGGTYSFGDLPSQTKDDAVRSFINDPNHGYYEDEALEAARNAKYRFRLMPPQQIFGWMEDLDLEDREIVRETKRQYVKELAKSIKRDGLRFPAVGYEGRSRGLAHLRLDAPLPYFDIID